MSKRYVRWDEIEDMCESADKAMREALYAPSVILAVARGGLAPAAMLAHRLGVRDVRSVSVVSYDDQHTKTRSAKLSCARDILVLQDLRHGKHNVLIVDDVIETGDTMQLMHRSLPRAKSFALTVKSAAGMVWADYVGAAYRSDEWLVFPWEQSGNQAADHAL